MTEIVYVNMQAMQANAPLVIPTTLYADPRLIAEISRLKEQADWLGGIFDDESMFSCGMDGTVQFGVGQGSPMGEQFGFRMAMTQALFRPGYFACFYINPVQHNIIRARSRAFTSVNPYWHGCQHAVRTHVVGTGHTWTAMQRHADVPVDKKRLAKVQKELDDFYARAYRQVQKEKSDRKSRDGEYFLRFLEDGEGREKRLRVRFVEPLNIWSPATTDSIPDSNEVLFGIEYKKGDYENPLRYHIRVISPLGGTDLRGTQYGWQRPVPASDIQHRKVNVDRSSPRGIPDTYWIQRQLEQSLRTLKAMGTLVQVRAKIAMVRTHVNALAGSVQGLLSQNAAATMTWAGGQTRTISQYADGSIIDASDQSTYQFPGQNIETDKIVSALQADLQSAAASMGLADYMLSGSLGKTSFASAMVAEGPVVKTFEELQWDCIEEDQEVAYRVIQTAMDAGRLEDDTLEIIKVEMHGPPLAGRNAIQEAQANDIYIKAGVKSITTVRQEIGLDAEAEAVNITKELPERQKMQLALNPPAQTGGGDDGTSQARNRQTSNARPFTPDQEGRQQQRASGATREEETRLMEHSSDDRAAMQPTTEDLEMVAIWITRDWLAKTKGEILALPIGPRGIDQTMGEYEPGIKGAFLGTVDGQQVWAVDMRAMTVRYSCPDLICAGNSAKWLFIPADKIVVDWSFVPYDRGLDVLHECIEYTLMRDGKWAYARAHRVSNYYEDTWLIELRPELAALKPAKE